MKQSFHLLFCFVFVLSFTATYSQRIQSNFDNNWQFHLGHAADASKDFNYTIANIFAKSGKAEGTAIDPKFNDSSWRRLNLPHDWAIELPFEFSPNFDVMSHGYRPVGGLYPQNSVGWYRKHFAVNKADSGHRFIIQFDGVFRNADFWINGFYLGKNQSGYVGVDYDITDYLNYDKDNVIVVRADASQYEGWFYEGAGIYRHVWLIQHNNVHADAGSVFAYSSVSKDQSATITVEASIKNDGLTSANTIATISLKDRDGNTVATTENVPISVAAGDQQPIKQTLKINQPRLWSLEDPYLYRVYIEVKNNDRIADAQTIRFGIRSVEILPNGVFVNGKHVKIKGTNNHQDHAGVGSALPDYLQYYRIRLLKEMGVNAYRTSHHAPTPELLDACDSLGVLVLDEQRLLNSSPEYVQQFERLIKRDRNHASVFLWSIGNEEGYIQANSTGKRIALSLLAIQKRLDPTRTSTYAADLPNVFTGVNEVIPVRGFNYREAAVADYHKDHPVQPIIGTEMGSTVTTRGIYVKDGVNAYVPDQDITAPWWASTAETWWKLCGPNDFWLGGFVWTGFDYRGEPTPYAWPNINSHFGIMDMCGFPKNIYYYYQSWWTDKDVLHISPHWNWAGKEGTPIDVWVNSNAQSVELFLNGKSLGKKNMPVNGHLQWSVVYQPGVLKAVAIKNGKRMETKVETTGSAYQLVLTPDRTVITSDGKDATVINVTAKDKLGREVPDVNEIVNFTIEGNGHFIGVGNGDPSSHEADVFFHEKWKRSLFNGKCQIIVQSNFAGNGMIKVEASAKGLQSAATYIQTNQ